jgi:hypothetical protein
LLLLVPFFLFFAALSSLHNASVSGCVRRRREKRKSPVCENVHEGCVCCCRLSNRVVEDLQLCKGIVYRYCWDAISLSPVVIAHCRYYAFCAFYYCCEISGRFSSSNFFWGDTLSYGTSIGTLSAGGSSVSFPPVHLDIRSSHERALSSELDAEGTST